jgi:hypothetical protein
MRTRGRITWQSLTDWEVLPSTDGSVARRPTDSQACGGKAGLGEASNHRQQSGNTIYVKTMVYELDMLCHVPGVRANEYTGEVFVTARFSA